MTVKKLLPLLFLSLSISAYGQIYVSPQGSDQSAGDREHPLRTLEHARDLARSKGIAQIILRGGTYRLAKPLQLTAEDSGRSFEAQPGESPILSGAVQVKGWKKIDAAKNLWSAFLPEGVSNSRQLYVDGVRATRTRGRVPVELTMNDAGYEAADSTMASWKNPSDIEFVYTGGNAVWNGHSVGLGSWTEPRCPIGSIQGKTILMAQPCWDNSTKRVMLPDWNRTANLVGPKSVGKEPTYVENAYELLGQPGQWYLDRAAKTIYYVPRKGEDLTKTDVELPVLETLVTGTGSPAQPIHNITFQGIQFSYATWPGSSSKEGFSEIQANYRVTGPDGYSKQALCDLVPGGTCPFGAWTPLAGNISFDWDHEIVFRNDAFVHLGAAGLHLGSGSQKDTVEGCLFTDISGNGLELAEVNAPLAPDPEFAADNKVENNLFRNVGAEYRGGIPIVVGYAKRTLIAHNQIDHVPYAGISMGWGGWPDKIKKPGQANNSTGNVVEKNLIHDFMLVLSDGGGIYTQGRTGKDIGDGEKVLNNVIYNQWSSGHGIYTDNGSAMITIRKNVIFNTNHDNWNSRHRDYYDGQDGKNADPLDIEENWWQQGDQDSDKEQVRVWGNHLIGALKEAPADILGNAGLEPAYRNLLTKTFTSATVAPEPPSRVAAFALNQSAYVTWSPSVFEGSVPVTSYIVTASDGTEQSVSAEEFLKTAYVHLKGLKNGTPYTITVRAVNAAGTSSPSLPTIPFTPSDKPLALPKAPATVKVLPGVGMVSIHVQAPAEKGPEEAGAITGYAVTVNPGGRKALLGGRNFVVLDGRHVTFSTVDGLKSGESYTFSVAAVNAAGEGEAKVTDPVTVK